MTLDRRGPGHRIALAIIEDDASYRRSLARLCRLLGFAADEFESGSAFLTSLDATTARYDCLLIDKMMPSMTGLELYAILLERGFQMPAVLITGDADPHTIALGAAAGIVACLEKPIEADTVRAVVIEAAARRPVPLATMLEATA